MAPQGHLHFLYLLCEQGANPPPAPEQSPGSGGPGEADGLGPSQDKGGGTELLTFPSSLGRESRSEIESKYFTRHFSSDLIRNNIPQSKNHLLSGFNSSLWPQECRSRGGPGLPLPCRFPSSHPTLLPVPPAPFNWLHAIHPSCPVLSVKDETNPPAGARPLPAHMQVNRPTGHTAPPGESG